MDENNEKNRVSLDIRRKQKELEDRVEDLQILLKLFDEYFCEYDKILDCDLPVYAVFFETILEIVNKNIGEVSQIKPEVMESYEWLKTFLIRHENEFMLPSWL